MSNTHKEQDDDTVVEQAPAAETPDEAGAGAPAGDADAGGETAEALRQQLDSARARTEAAEERALRLQAEMDNLRKRTEREVQNAHKYGTEKLLTELLPVLDSMEQGVAAAKGEGADVASTREGMELTMRTLQTAMEKFGIETVDPADQPFDPDAHQAISMQPAEGVAANTVLAVVRKGYRLNGRLVRPAMVVVAR